MDVPPSGPEADPIERLAAPGGVDVERRRVADRVAQAVDELDLPEDERSRVHEVISGLGEDLARFRFATGHLIENLARFAERTASTEVGAASEHFDAARQLRRLVVADDLGEALSLGVQLLKRVIKERQQEQQRLGFLEETNANACSALNRLEHELAERRPAEAGEGSAELEGRLLALREERDALRERCATVEAQLAEERATLERERLRLEARLTSVEDQASAVERRREETRSLHKDATAALAEQEDRVLAIEAELLAARERNEELRLAIQTLRDEHAVERQDVEADLLAQRREADEREAGFGDRIAELESELETIGGSAYEVLAAAAGTVTALCRSVGGLGEAVAAGTRDELCRLAADLTALAGDGLPPIDACSELIEVVGDAGARLGDVLGALGERVRALQHAIDRDGAERTGLLARLEQADRRGQDSANRAIDVEARAEAAEAARTAALAARDAASTRLHEVERALARERAEHGSASGETARDRAAAQQRLARLQEECDTLREAQRALEQEHAAERHRGARRQELLQAALVTVRGVGEVLVAVEVLPLDGRRRLERQLKGIGKESDRLEPERLDDCAELVRDLLARLVEQVGEGASAGAAAAEVQAALQHDLETLREEAERLAAESSARGAAQERRDAELAGLREEHAAARERLDEQARQLAELRAAGATAEVDLADARRRHAAAEARVAELEGTVREQAAASAVAADWQQRATAAEQACRLVVDALRGFGVQAGTVIADTGLAGAGTRGLERATARLQKLGDEIVSEAAASGAVETCRQAGRCLEAFAAELQRLRIECTARHVANDALESELVVLREAAGADQALLREQAAALDGLRALPEQLTRSQAAEAALGTELQALRDQVTRSRRDSSADLEELRASAAERDRLLGGEIAGLRQALGEAEAALREQIAAGEERDTERDAERAAATARGADLARQLAERDARLAGLEARHEEAERELRGQAGLQARQAALEAELQQVRRDNEELRRAAAAAEQVDTVALAEEREALQRQVARLERQLAREEARRLGLDDVHRLELADAEHRLENAQAEHSAALARIEQHQDEARTLRRELAGLRARFRLLTDD